MAANTSPIYTLTPNVGTSQVGSTALTKSDGSAVTGIGTDIFKVFTAGSNGSYVTKIRFQPVGTTAATATSATVFRVYVSSKTSGNTANTDTYCIGEIAAAAQTTDQTTTATYYLEMPLGFALTANWTILVSSHIVNAANTNWTATVFGGDY